MFKIKLFSTFIFTTFLIADIPPGYYDDAQGLDGEPLRLALHNIIEDHIPKVIVRCMVIFNQLMQNLTGLFGICILMFPVEHRPIFTILQARTNAGIIAGKEIVLTGSILGQKAGSTRACP